jgi:hypothetical protein
MRSLRAGALLAPSTAATANPWASEALAASHHACPHATPKVDPIPVPSIVDPAVFEAAQTQLEENRKRKGERRRGRCWLLQGLTVCQRCRYAYYGKTAPRSRKYDPMNALNYYRCIGEMATDSAAKQCATIGPSAATSWGRFIPFRP